MRRTVPLGAYRPKHQNISSASNEHDPTVALCMTETKTAPHPFITNDRMVAGFCCAIACLSVRTSVSKDASVNQAQECGP
jgi:hypothetical protein